MSDTLGGFHYLLEPGQPGSRTLLLLHGTGGDERDLLPLGRALDPRASLLSPRGQVLEGRMPRFFRRLAEGVFDQADLAQRTAQLGAFVREATARHGLLPGDVWAVGFSNGANIAASLLLREPGLLAGAILFRAMVPFEPVQQARGRSVPVLLRAGELDPIVPRENAERLAALLGAAGAEVSLEWSRGGHGLGHDDLEAAAAWLAATDAPVRGNA